MSDLKIFAPASPAHYAAVRLLFGEYIDFLYSLPNMRVHVDIQDPQTELAELETGKYTPPNGALLLAMQDDTFIGVVALRKLADDICEMKRLYVNPGSRGSSIGRVLAEQIIQKAKAIGYKKMRLDTHPAMTKAHRLYYSLGFYDIPAYNQNIVPDALFMELDLQLG